LPAAACLLGFGFAIILTGPVISGVLRPITWGVPAACMVAGAVGLEGRLFIPRWLRDAGDASYSIYLMHPFVVPVVFIIVAKTLPENVWLPVTIIGSLAASIAVGRLGFVGIERPLMRLMRRSSNPPTIAITG
jgi:exopolysaccharide production protein ExoZ